MAEKILDFQDPNERFEAERQANERTQQEWAAMLFNDRLHLLDREKRHQRLEDLKRIQMLKRGLRQYE